MAKTTLIYYPSNCGPEVQAWLHWVLCLGKSQMKVLAGSHSFLEPLGEEYTSKIILIVDGIPFFEAVHLRWSFLCWLSAEGLRS